MKCPACGSHVVKTSIYCHKCGERLDLSNPVDEPTRRPATAVENSARPEATESDATPNERFRDLVGSGRGNNRDATEEQLWEGGYCAKAMMGAWILSGLATLVLIVLAIVVWGNPVLFWVILALIALVWLYELIVFAQRRLGVRYRLTSQRFFHERGILVHTTDLIEVIDMDDITYRQTIIDRLFDVGTIRIISSDQSHPDLAVQGIADVKNVAAKMHNARHAERVRRGLHIESI
ncbi:MAG: PH domain-containing protein [Pirellulales bacterium]|nr:PH domain-containing protein [Pirellulales bacterium]